MTTMRNEIPDDLTADILWRLPPGPWISRFRCVSKSWRDLLSDPSLMVQKLSADDAAASSSSGHQIMIKSQLEYYYIERRPSVVSVLHSAANDSLEPLLLPENNNYNYNYNNYCHYHLVDPSFEVEECCNGVFCLSQGDRTHFTLWNPATSEIKVVPPFPYHSFGGGLLFGFDSETNDYKIIRQVGKSFYQVYSLRKDSWRRLYKNAGAYYPECLPCDDERFSQLRKGKLYWSRQPEEADILLFESFDMSREAFGRVELPYPPGRKNLSASLKRLLYEESMVAVFEVYYNDGVERYPSHDVNSETCWEIWALWKYWAPESWTKLSVVVTPLADFIGFSRNLKCFFFTPSFVFNTIDDCAVIDVPTGKSSHFQIRAKDVMTYVPSQIPLRSYYVQAA